MIVNIYTYLLLLGNLTCTKIEKRTFTFFILVILFILFLNNIEKMKFIFPVWNYIGSIKSKKRKNKSNSKKNCQKIIGFFKKIYNYKGLSPNVCDILKDMGNSIIQSATIGKIPFMPLYDFIIKSIYTTNETLFHSFIILHTTTGDLLLEKNEVINIQKRGALKNSELIKIQNVPSNITVQKFINNVVKHRGVLFVPFDIINSNCQDFQIDILTSNNMITPELKSFIKQDLTKNLKNNFNNIINIIIDLVGWVNVLCQFGYKIVRQHL